jgi:CRP/FNR family transcriptional regulator
MEVFEPHSIVFTENSPAKQLFVLFEGQVKLSINSRAGKRLNISVATAGELLGIPGVVQETTYFQTAETIGRASIGGLPAEEFRQVLENFPEALYLLTIEMCRAYEQACRLLRTVGLPSNVRQKLARFLLDLCNADQPSAQHPRGKLVLTHGEIGEFIGASRETVTRTLTNFRRARLVAIRGSSVVILNPQALLRCSLH